MADNLDLGEIKTNGKYNWGAWALLGVTIAVFAWGGPKVINWGISKVTSMSAPVAQSNPPV